MIFPRPALHGIIVRLNRPRLFPHSAVAAWSALLVGLSLSVSGRAAGAAAPDPYGAAANLQAFPGTEEGAGTPAQAPSAPIEGRIDPDTYRVGPGDEFALRYSDLLDPRVLRVGPAGELLLPDAGPVVLAGLTLRQAEARVRDVLRPYVRGKGFVIALHRPRRFRLQVLGDVERPGVVTLQAPVRASEAIDEAGGVSPGGAKRGIQVRRGPDTLRVDLIRYQRAGDLSSNPLVFETDVLFVPASGRVVEIQGAVAHGGQFDFAEGDRLSTLVSLGGGILPEAAIDDAALVRFKQDGTREAVSVRLAAAIAAPGGSDDLPIAEGDRLFVPSRSHWREVPYVWVEGEVLRPGPYSIEEGTDRIRSLLERTGGYTEFADRRAVRVERLFELAEPDTAFLRLARERDQILSAGERSYVVMKTRERNALSAPVGALLEAGDARGDVALRRGDRIVVPRQTAVVSVQGEVRAPGHVPYEPGRSVDDYVKAAGEYTSRAYKSRVRITLAATGRQVGVGETKEILPGDVIWVPAKPDRNPWGTIRDIIGVTAAAAAIVLAIEAVNQ